MAAQNLSTKLIESHLVQGESTPGSEVELSIDQALLQDVLGTLVMLELEGMGLERAVPQPTVQYIDHALVQQDPLSAEAHRFLKSACDRFGIWYSGPGNGISHPVHMERFGVPGQSLVGSDSHTTAAGSLGMLAIGAGGIEVALVIAGEPLVIPMPKIWGIEIKGELPDWVSARDVVLELLRRHGVAGAKNCILEFYGEGLQALSAMDRHIIANMSTEMGATSALFPSDERTREFLTAREREADWQPLMADPGCTYDHYDYVDLRNLEPLIALPSSPGNVVPVSDVVGEPIYQSYIGSSGCPGYSEFATTARMCSERGIADGVSLDVNPTSRQVLGALIESGDLAALVTAGARVHQAGCNGCIGMGQAPARGQNSLRTVPRNFPGRSGTDEDRVYLCSAETAAASAITGVITDPRTLGLTYVRPPEPAKMPLADAGFTAPKPVTTNGVRSALAKSENTPPLPKLQALPDNLTAPIILRLGDDVSTDDIMPAGTALPYWCNVHASAQFLFKALDGNYPTRAKEAESVGHVIIAGENYGQGSSRENAALVPALQGLRVVVAHSFARIHWQNLVCFGVLPLSPATARDKEILSSATMLAIKDIHRQLSEGSEIQAEADGKLVRLSHELTSRQRELVACGGVINYLSNREELVNGSP